MPHEAARQHAGSARVRLMMRVGGTLYRRLYRVSGGRLGGALGPLPVLLLTTTGRTRGQPRTWPVGYVRDGARRTITASAGGEPTPTAWYRTLRANPRVTVQLGRETRLMLARPATGAERARLWAHLVGEYPTFAADQQQTIREIPVVILTTTAA